MNRFYLLLLLIFVFCENIFAQKSKIVYVYLIGGQSNATGQGYMQNKTDSMHIDTAVWIFNSGTPYLNSGQPPYIWQPLHQASESKDRFGPELGFASKIHELFPAKQIALIKHANSGSNLYNEWKPGVNVVDSLNWGVHFKVFVQTVNRGLAALRKQGYKPVISGMLWQQGEADASAKDSISGQYATNLTQFIKRVREQFNMPKMPFVYGYVLPPPNTGTGRDLVRKAQQDLDANSGSKLAVKDAYVVETDDLSLRANDKNSPYPKDYRHFGTDGTWLLGVRMAAKMAQVPIPLYSGEIPNSRVSNAGAEPIMPTLTPFLAENQKLNNTGVIICPGGGYSWVSYKNEGISIAEALNKLGISAFVLTYRLPVSDHMEDRSIAPLQDAQQAIKLLREKAAAWHLDVHKIGIAGFSAGGHLAATAATHFDKSFIPNKNKTNLRPDFAILCYPVISFTDSIGHVGSRTNLLGTKNPTPELIRFFSNELQVTAQTPPAFIIHSENDAIVNVSNSLAYYQALCKNKIPSELHIYPRGVHGFGLNNTASTDKWFERLINWMKDNNYN